MSDHISTRSPAFVCRCEERTAGEISAAISAGARTINDVKRRTRAGMGNCQGVYCLHIVAEIVERELGVDRATVFPMTGRPPARVISLESLANLTDPE